MTSMLDLSTILATVNVTGYYGNQFECMLCVVDVDECALGTDECDIHANCINYPGYYECHCRAGYLGNGFQCYPCEI